MIRLDKPHYRFEIIHEELLRQGRTVLWLSQQLGCNRTNIYNIFVRDSISTDLLMKISIALNKDFFVLFSKHYISD